MTTVVKQCGQQGDVRLRRVAAIPDEAKAVARSVRGYVLAEGEATGHAHVITEEVELYEHEGTFYLKTDHATTIQHEEHRPITLSPGIWRVGRVREKDMLEGFVRTILD